MEPTKLSHHDLAWILRRTPKKILALLCRHPGEVFIAGGFIRACIANETVSDIDLFTKSKEQAEAMAKELVGEKEERLYTTENAITVKGFGLPIQFIHRWTFNSPEDCLQSFDFTIAMGLVYCKAFNPSPTEQDADAGHPTWEGISDPRFYQDLAAKRLVYTSPIRNEEAGGSMLRVLKFYQRGYRMPLSSLGAVIGRMMRGVPQEKLEERKGMTQEDWERQIGHVLTGLLREVDPAHDPKHLAHLPDPGELADASEEFEDQ